MPLVATPARPLLLRIRLAELRNGSHRGRLCPRRPCRGWAPPRRRPPQFHADVPRRGDPLSVPIRAVAAGRIPGRRNDSVVSVSPAALTVGWHDSWTPCALKGVLPMTYTHYER